MDEKIKSILNDYLKNVSDIYKEVSNWLNEHSLLYEEKGIEIFEEASGKYHINKLIICKDKNKQIAEIRPIGAWIVGGRGRLDLIGKLDQQILIYLNKCGTVVKSSITTSIGDEHHEVSGNTYSLYKGIVQDGWYWIENKNVGKAHILNKELFFRLIAEISDYEF